MIRSVALVIGLAACGSSSKPAAAPAAAEAEEAGERDVPADQVPAAVRDAAAKAMPPGASIAYELQANGNYEAEAIVDGKEVEAMFAPDGTQLPTTDD
jgi:hypothetical protein